MIKYYRRLKYVDRLSRWPHQREYNVLEHSFMVVALFMHFADKEGISYDTKVIRYIVNHDVLEAVTGDLGYDIKNLTKTTRDCWETIEHIAADNEGNAKLAEFKDFVIENRLNETQYWLFKCCDLLDLWIFCKEEQHLGNQAGEIENIIRKAERIIHGNGMKISPIDSIITYMQEYSF